MVVASLDDRIIQRAILDVLQSQENLVEIQNVIQTKTSFGGISGKGTGDAIDLVEQAFLDGYKFVYGSDIASFFTKIPKDRIIGFLANATDDVKFLELFKNALVVELGNSEQLKINDIDLFPVGNEGVAQGSPLSALAGNILLKEFDTQMNEEGRNVICLRYIDDFLLMGKNTKSLTNAEVRCSSHLCGTI